MSQRHALTDAPWNQIKGFLPGQQGDPGRTAADNRLFVDAILFVAKTGIPWRDLPERFGKWNSVWRRFDRWCELDVWRTLAQQLGEPDLIELQLDSTSIKVHVAGVGGRRRTAENKEDADQRRCLGRSRGGLNAKVHAAVDAHGHLVRMQLSPGQDGDGPHGRALLAEFAPGQIEHVLADAAYDGDETRPVVKPLKAKACLKPHGNRTTKKRCDKGRDKHRNLVERFFGRIKQFRRVATRYEKTAENFAGFVWLAALIVDCL